MAEENAFGIDVSKYNGAVDWSVAKAHGVRFAGIRASISWAYQDPYLAWNIRNSFGLSGRFFYHVLYPGESITRQVDNFLSAVGDNWSDSVPVLDAELDHGKDKDAITRAIILWCEEVQKRLSIAPVIYSRATWINQYTMIGDWRNRWDWWLAQYLFDRTKERPAPPAKPTGVKNWLIHQNADKYPAWPGFPGPGGITTVDTNRWNGPLSAVKNYFKRGGSDSETGSLP